MNFIANRGYPTSLSEDDLILMAQRGSRRAHERLVSSQMPTIRRLAKSFETLRVQGIEMDDLVQQGVLALLRSIRGYRPEIGRTLANFSIKSIHGAMTDHVRRALAPVSLPRPVLSSAVPVLVPADIDLAGPSAIRLAPVSVVPTEFSGMAAEDGFPSAPPADVPDDLPEGGQAAGPALVSQEATPALASVRSDPARWRPDALDALCRPIADPEQIVIADDLCRARRDVIDKALAGLDRRAAIVVRARHLRQPALSLGEIAALLRVTPQRVHQIEREAIDRLGRRLHAMRASQTL